MYKTFSFLTLMGAVFFNTEGDTGGGATPPAVTPPAGTQTPPAGTQTPPAGAEPAAKLWYDDIPEAPVKELMTAKGYKTPAEVAMAYHNLNKLVSSTPGGADALIASPAADAPQEQWDAFYKKLGRPEAPTDYVIKAAEGVTPDEGMVKFAQETFHAAGLSPKQAETVAAAWDKYVGERAAADATQFAEANAAELEAYKSGFKGNFDEAVAAGRRTVQALGLEQSVLDKLEGSIGAAALLEVFSKIGLKSGEGGFVGGAAGGAAGGNVAAMSPEGAAAEAQRLMGDEGFLKKYGDRHHPEHKDAVAKMEALYARAG